MILPGRATGSAYFKPASGRLAKTGARLARSRSGARSPLPRANGEIVGNGRIDRLEIDDFFALDNAEPQPRIRGEPDDFHERVL